MECLQNFTANAVDSFYRCMSQRNCVRTGKLHIRRDLPWRDFRGCPDSSFEFTQKFDIWRLWRCGFRVGLRHWRTLFRKICGPTDLIKVSAFRYSYTHRKALRFRFDSGCIWVVRNNRYISKGTFSSSVTDKSILIIDMFPSWTNGPEPVYGQSFRKLKAIHTIQKIRFLASRRNGMIGRFPVL